MTKFWAEAGLKAETTLRPAFAILTLGCKVNQYESEVLALDLKLKGWRRTGPGQSPDVVIINSCTVTGKAAMQARQLIRKTIRENPRAQMVVTGCYAQTEPEEIGKISGVHYIVGQARKNGLADFLEEERESQAFGTRTSPLVMVDDITHLKTLSSRDFPVAESRTRPAVRVQDGCNAFCSYCIVPHARGRSRSLPVTDVIDQVNRIADLGYKEVVITGIHLGLYGKDLVPRTDLGYLLVRLLHETPIPRIRISSVEPDEISPEIIQLIQNNPRLCRHFHLPLQSGDNTILKRMRRPYTREYFQDLVWSIREQIPDAGIGADVLAGFPGESPRQFQNTLDLIQALPLTHLHVFPFSPRKGTPAAGFPDRVSPDEIKQRCEQLRNLGSLKKEAFYQSLVGKQVSVLVEEITPGPEGMLKGLSSQYAPVKMHGPENLKNTVVTATVTKVLKDSEMACLGIL
jgi:threonylcarbamoyladenosine tRNA methylthiotransferase MtaB